MIDIWSNSMKIGIQKDIFLPLLFFHFQKFDKIKLKIYQRLYNIEVMKMDDSGKLLPNRAL